MPVPISQAWTVATYVLKQKLKGRKRYPFVLMHPQIEKIVEGLVARKKYIYLCTNALLLKEKLHLFQPSKYLTFSVHMDGQKEHHDFSVCREGGYELAVEGIKEALK